jgi:hypothetical protein
MEVIDNRTSQKLTVFTNLKVGDVFYHQKFPDMGFYMKIKDTPGVGDSLNLQSNLPAYVGNEAHLVKVNATITIED